VSINEKEKKMLKLNDFIDGVAENKVGNFSVKDGSEKKYKACINGKTTRLGRIYYAMRTRCYNEKSGNYPYYGGKGIIICNEWHDFETFARWAYSHGYNDTLTIDRIDSNKNYCPENCRWIPFSENDSRAHKGQIINQDQRESIRKKLQGKNNPKARKIKCLETGIVFDSIADASRISGIGVSCLVRVAKGKRNLAKGTHWVYVEA
jgi:hypothetical protein